MMGSLEALKTAAWTPSLGRGGPLGGPGGLRREEGTPHPHPECDGWSTQTSALWFAVGQGPSDRLGKGPWEGGHPTKHCTTR